jgi:two-component system, OmpR family, phosphate regulon sensor histidine kinase PhoR
MADDTQALRDRIEELERQLEESQQALEAIRRGDVESLVVDGPGGPRIYSLEWSIYSFRVLVEAISEGTLTMGEDGVVLYCNSRFAKMLLAPLEHVMGNPLRRWVSERSLPALEELMSQAVTGDGRAEIALLNTGGREVRACLSASTIRDNGELVFCLVATDLTDLRPAPSAKMS